MKDSAPDSVVSHGGNYRGDPVDSTRAHSRAHSPEVSNSSILVARENYGCDPASMGSRSPRSSSETMNPILAANRGTGFLFSRAASDRTVGESANQRVFRIESSSERRAASCSSSLAGSENSGSFHTSLRDHGQNSWSDRGRAHAPESGGS